MNGIWQLKIGIWRSTGTYQKEGKGASTRKSITCKRCGWSENPSARKVFYKIGFGINNEEVKGFKVNGHNGDKNSSLKDLIKFGKRRNKRQIQTKYNVNNK